MSVLSRADLLRVLGAGGLTSLESAAEQMGLVRAEPNPTAGSDGVGGAPSSAPRERPAPAARRAPTPFTRVVRSVYAQESSNQAPPESSPRSDGLTAAELRGEAVLVEGAERPSVALCRTWRDWSGDLHAALTGAEQQGRVDLPQVLHRMARLKSIDPLPRTSTPGLAQALWLVVDRGLATKPFHREQEALLMGLIRTYGARHVRVVGLSHGPHDRRLSRLVERVQAGELVFLVSEFEVAQQHAWATQGRRLLERGAGLIAASVLGHEAPGPWRTIGARPRPSLVDRDDVVDDVFTALAYASLFDAGHLREVCRARGLGPEWEWEVWNDPRVERGADGRAWLDESAERAARERLRAAPPGQRAQAVEIQQRWRRHTVPDIWAEEYIALWADGLDEFVPPDYRKLARDFVARLETTRRTGTIEAQGSLHSWVWRLKDRVSERAFEAEDELGRQLQKAWWGAAQGREPQSVPAGLNLTIAAEPTSAAPEDFVLAATDEGVRVISGEKGSWVATVEAKALDGVAASLVPAWAADAGVDSYGRWARVDLAGASFVMRWIEPGRFLMGSPEDEEGRNSNEGPQHKVTLTEGYWLAEAPCTQAAWKAVMGDNPSGFVGEERPVESVSHDDVARFILGANALVPGLDLALPSEAQWEHACRAGSDGERYGPLDDVAWYEENSESGTHPVKGTQANDWGLYDMLGNVWEWCADGATDWNEPDAYPAKPVSDPVAPAGERPFRVVRGGSWDSHARCVRAAYRDADPRDDRGIDVGFRVARGRAQGEAKPAEQAPAPEAGPRGTSETVPRGAAHVHLVEGARLPVDLRMPARLQTDVMTLDLEPLVRPYWAHGVGRDRFGLYADVEVEPKQRSVMAVGFRFRWIPPGRFWMGSREREVGANEDERPRHMVTLTKGYWLASTPCTQSVWEGVLGKDANRSVFRSPDRPVEKVSFDDVSAFLSALGKQVPGVRLPTEAEWEHACRAGTTGATDVGELSDENRAPILDDIAWYGANSDAGFELDNGQGTVLNVKNAGTHPVGQKPANPWGLHDMLGNVWEWCSDGGSEDFEPDAYSEDPVSDPEAPAGERPYRVVRGGSWFDDARGVRAAARVAPLRDFRDLDLGFRVARGRAPEGE